MMIWINKMCGGGGVRDFFQSVPHEDFKWNSPYYDQNTFHCYASLIEADR